MAVWSEARLSELPGSLRLDAEFWQPCYTENETALRRHTTVPLGSVVSTFRKGIFYILASEYVDSGVPFYRSANVQNIVPSDAGLAYISEERDRSDWKTSLQRGDIMLAKTGRHGASVVLRERCNVSQDVIAVKVEREKVNPFFLAVYLNTNVGRLELRRWFQGQAQEHLSLADAQRVNVPLLTAEVQQNAQEMVEQSELLTSESKRTYAEAETLLEAALGLDELDLTPQLFYERSYSEVEEAGRFDAEYFNPRTQNIIEALSRDGSSISNVADLAKRRFRPEAGAEFRYIEIADVTANGTVDSNPLWGDEAPSRATQTVRSGDVITTTVRPIRRLSAVVTDEQNGHVCSSGFAVLTPEEIEPELLLIYLRLPLVCELLDLHTTASMYPAISTAELMKTPISLPDDATRKQIVTKVRESFDARREARQLLEEARAMVERAILCG